VFARVFEAWYDIFNFKCTIDQASFAEALDSKRPILFVVVPHGVIPLGCFLGIAYARNYLPGNSLPLDADVKQ
jgi:hypothetical protein